MIAVSSTRWSPNLATLLLVMSTTLQPFLLPTVQASSVVSGIARQMWRPWVDSNSDLTNRALATGLLGKVSSNHSSDAQACINAVQGNAKAHYALVNCTAYQLPWLDLVNATTDNETERSCMDVYCGTYCGNLITSSFCLPDQYAAYRKEILQPGLDNSAQGCKPWDRFIPSLDSPPPITNETIQCGDTVVANGGKRCAQEALENLKKMNITDPIEFTCKMLFECEKCDIKVACPNCAGGSVDEYLNFIGKVWSPGKVRCTKWANEEPKMECPARSSTGSPVTPSKTSSSPASVSVTTSSSNPANVSTVGPVTSSLPGNTSSSPASVCDSKVDEKGAECVAEAKKKYPDFEANDEMRCKYAYYLADCAVEAVCKYCTDSETKEQFNEARKGLDEIREGCKQWWSDEPKLECPSSSTTTSSSSTTTVSSNTLMIVGIIIGVLVLLVAIGVAVYCLCFSTDKSAGPSSNAGSGGGSGASSKINSGKAGSTMDSKQQSRIEAKQSSRA